MSEEELDLIQFAARQVAQTGAGASQVVRRQFGDASRGGRRPYDVPGNLRRHPLPQTRPTLLMARNTVPAVMPAAVVHASMASLTQAPWARADCPPLPTRSAITRCSSHC